MSNSWQCLVHLCISWPFHTIFHLYNTIFNGVHCRTDNDLMIYKNSKQIHVFSYLKPSLLHCHTMSKKIKLFQHRNKKSFPVTYLPYMGETQAPEFLTDSLIPLSSAKDTTKRTWAAQLFWATHCEWQEIGQSLHMCRTSTLSHQPATTSRQTVYTYRGSSRSAGFLWLEGTFP